MKLTIITRSLLLGASRLITTPQPFRKSKPSEREHLRGLFDAEFWDNFLAQVYSLSDTSLPTLTPGNTLDYTIPVTMPVAGQVQIVASVAPSYTAGATNADFVATSLLDGVESPLITSRPIVRHHNPSTSGVWHFTFPVVKARPAAKGVHPAGIRIKNNSAAGGPNMQILEMELTIVRRKAPPP